jgi:hypothetical protein
MAVVGPIEEFVYVTADFAGTLGIKAPIGHKEVPLCFHVQ